MFYFQIINEQELKSSNIFKIKINEQNIQNNLPLTNIYVNKEDLLNNDFILKCGISSNNRETRPRKIKSLITLNDDLNRYIKSSEIEFLKRAKEKNVNSFIVMIVADRIDIFEMNNIIILEMSNSTLGDYCFDKNSTTIKKKHSIENYIEFLKQMHLFFINVANFLYDEGVVYCDWKFENILIFLNHAK